MRQLKKSLVAFFIIFLNPASLWAVDYSLVGVLNVTQMVEENNFGTVKGDGLLNGGGGILFDFDLNSLFQMETGLIYLDRTFGFERDKFSGTFLQAPFLIKINFTSTLFLSTGLYLDYRAGEITRENLSGNSVASSFSSINYGAQLGLGYKYPISASTSLLFEFDYLKDLSNRSEANSVNRTFNEYRLLLGLHWGSSELGDYSSSSNFEDSNY